MVELGKIEKPEASQFSGKRKLYLVPLVFSAQESEAGYLDKYEAYWQQVAEHIARLEAQIGRVSHIYCEYISLSDENGLKAIERLNSACHRIAAEKAKVGARLEPTEDEELADESMDWQRCLLAGLSSRAAAELVSKSYVEALKKRYAHIAKSITGTLQEGEAGVLFIQESHMVQFPPDIQVFMVAPPALDEIHRWLRERSAKAENAEK